MKIILVVFLGLLFFNSLFFSSKTTLKLELLIGDYYDDHYKKVFNYSEKKWDIEKNKLMYKIIDRKNYYYADTIFLSQHELDTIKQVIEKQALRKNITIAYNSNSSKYMRYKKEVKGNLYLGNEKYTYQIESNSTAIEEKEEYQHIETLESYFYKLIEQN